MSQVSDLYLEGESQEEGDCWDVGEDALVEAGREVRVGGVPAQLEVPQLRGAERSCHRSLFLCLGLIFLKKYRKEISIERT